MEKVKISFKELWKILTATNTRGEFEDIDIEQVIEQDSELSENDKKILLNSMKNTEKLERKIFKESLEKNNSAKRGNNNLEIPINALANGARKKIANEKAERVIKEMEKEI